MNLKNLYKTRFSKEEVENKKRIWKVLCENFFQKFIKKNDVVVDIACGYGEFINNITAKQLIGVDLNKDSIKHIKNKKNIKFLNNSAENINLKNNTVDLCFVSNFFEHIENKDKTIEIVLEIKRILKKNGTLICMGPNIKYSNSQYWDFFDHKQALSHLSIQELFASCGLKVEKVYSKFLPLTTKSLFPTYSFLIKLYLLFKPLWFVFGKQFLVIARK